MIGEHEPNRVEQASELIELNEQLHRAIQSALSSDLFATAVRELDSLPHSLGRLTDLQQQMWQAGLAEMEATYLRNLPDNWLEIEPSVLDVIEAVKESGFCLVWAPRGELVVKLVDAANRAEREDLLAAARETVLADLSAAMQAVGTVKLAGFKTASAFARDAIAAAKDGHMTAAQALAACGLESAPRLSFGISSWSQVRKRFEQSNVDAVRAMLMKLTLLQVCTAKALAQFDESSPLPEGFNRHATQHGERACFSDANALAGLLLLVGWLREFRWFADHHPEVLGSAD